MNTKHSEDIQHIRSMMERSSRFISLSGLSGVIAGCIALIAAYLAYLIIGETHSNYYDIPQAQGNNVILQLMLLGTTTLVLSISAGVYFTVRKSKKHQLPVFNNTTYLLLESMSFPLIAGGFVCLSFLYYRDLYYIAPATLVFYGLGLISASKYTYGDVKYLGISELILGLIGFYFIGYGLFLWALGFGVLHIIYGLIMYKKYK